MQLKNKKTFSLFFFIFCLFLFIPNLYSIEFIKKHSFIKKATPINITADIIRLDKKNSIFYAEGYVQIIKDNIKIEADKVKYFLKKDTFIASGNVKITQESGDYILANKLTFNLKDSSGIINKGEIFIKKKNFHIRGETIEKKNDGSYVLKNVTITSCDQKEPLWSFKCKEAKITPEGTGKAKKIKFYVKYIPFALLYAPYANFPAKAERSSGFLSPSIDFSGKFGARYSQGYYWALNRSSDATFYYDFMAKRGIKVGGEYRYLLTENGKGQIKAFYLQDSGMHEEDYNIPDQEKKRFLINFTHEQNFEKNLRIYANIYKINDINYKLDFPEDFKKPSFMERQAAESANSLNSIFFIQKKLDFINMNLDFSYYKDLTKPSNRQTSQKLPEATIFVSQNDFINANFYSQLDAEYLNLYRREGDSFSRIFIKPTFTKSISIGNIIITQTSISPTFVEYFFDVSDKSLGNENKTYLDIKHSGFIKFDKVIDFPFFNLIALRHIVEPYYEYRYISDTKKVFQKFNHFDYLDDELSEHIVKYGIRQRYLSKNEQLEYNEFLYWDIYQIYQIEKKDYLNNGKDFSHIFSDMKVRLWDYFVMDNDFEINTYDKNFSQFNISGTIYFMEKSYASLSYRYTRDNLEQLTSSFNVNFLEDFNIYNYFYYNYRTNQLETITYGFRYSPQCFSLDFNLINDKHPSEVTFNFLFTLKGIGTWGTGF